MNIASLLRFLVAAALLAGNAAAPLAAQEPDAEAQVEIDLVAAKIDTFFRQLTDKSEGGPERAVRQIIGSSPLKDRNDDINKLIDQATNLDQRYGAYTGNEQASARAIGKDLIFLRYLYKGERFPVVWYFTFYRSGSNGSLTREWRLIGLRFDSKVEGLDR